MPPPAQPDRGCVERSHWHHVETLGIASRADTAQSSVSIGRRLSRFVALATWVTDTQTFTVPPGDFALLSGSAETCVEQFVVTCG